MSCINNITNKKAKDPFDDLSGLSGAFICDMNDYINSNIGTRTINELIDLIDYLFIQADLIHWLNPNTYNKDDTYNYWWHPWLSHNFEALEKSPIFLRLGTFLPPVTLSEKFFYEASYKDNKNSAEIYLLAGMDINAIDQFDHKETALMWAVSWNDFNLIRYLVENGANINAQNFNGCTALDLAVTKDYLTIVQYLVEHGADINAKDKFGSTALMKSATHNNCHIAKYLVEHGADINARDNKGWTTLTYAQKFGADSCLQYLFQCFIQQEVQRKSSIIII